MAEQIVKKGYLDSHSKGRTSDSQAPEEWKRRFYVLYSSSESNKARLDWFSDESAFRVAPAVRKTIFVEEITKITSCDISGHQHAFQVTTLRRPDPFKFSADNKGNKKEWIDQLTKVMDEGKQRPTSKQPKGGEGDLGEGVYGNQLWGLDERAIEYDVTIGETPSAEVCNLNNKKRTLQIFAQCMALVHNEGKAKNKLLFVWPYRFVRRYGRSKTSFTFEAGRRCASGEGVFIFLTPSAEEIFGDIQKMNDQDKPEKVSNPTLPMRGYGEHYGEIILNNRQHQSKDYARLNSDGEWTTQNGQQSSGPPAPPAVRPPVNPSAPPQSRERTLSSSSNNSRILPPVPAQSRNRPVQPLPPATGGQEVLYSDIGGDDQKPGYRYSSVQKDQNKTVAAAGSDAYAYSEPVTPQGSSMSAIIAQMRMNNSNADAEEDEYDKVTINVMKKADEGMMDTVPEACYGQLYGDLSNQRPAVQQKNVPEESEYQEVRHDN